MNASANGRILRQLQLFIKISAGFLVARDDLVRISSNCESVRTRHYDDAVAVGDNDVAGHDEHATDMFEILAK